MGLFIITISILFIILAITVVVKDKDTRLGPPKTVCSPVPKKRFQLDAKVKLNMKAIIRWEQLRNKSFSLMDYSDKEDVEALLYTTTICNSDGVRHTFDVFRTTLTNKKLVREMVLRLERETAMLRQFQKKQEGTNLDNADGSPETISGIVSTLIISGLDARYALEEMELCDLPLYIEAYEKKRKEDMESARMWTYLTILPHIDAKKMKNGAKDLIAFPWEEQEKEAEKEIKETEIERFEAFMQEGKDYLNL